MKKKREKLAGGELGVDVNSEVTSGRIFTILQLFEKVKKKGKNELELTSKLTSPPTKVFTSGKTSYTKTSLKKSPKLNRFFLPKVAVYRFFL